MGKSTDPKSVRCRKCQDGKHEDCQERACYCHCMRPSDDNFRPPPPLSSPHHRDIRFVLQRMKDHGVVARLGGDHPNYEMVYRPQPHTLPPEIKALLTQYRRELFRALAPSGKAVPTPRQYWTIDSIRACVCCGRGCAARNPLGEVMHQWCGFVTQVPPRIYNKPAPMYPMKRTG